MASPCKGGKEMTVREEREKVSRLSDTQFLRLMEYARLGHNTMEQQAKCNQEEETSTAYDKLQKLIGLTEVKQQIDRVIALQRLQNIAHIRGKVFENPAMHMAFLGPPGTGKTIVARLLAGILKEYGICPKGTFIEAGRANLISDHVGGTAPMVKEICRKAKGGILFIDEAYALVKEGDASYIDEFIATLITEMENNRNDLIVIFAGYEQEMQAFLESNPGFRSRIPFVINFPNYTPTELLEIARHIAKEKQFEITASAEERLLSNFKIAMQSESFGNARFVRTQVEFAIMEKAMSLRHRSGLLQMSDEELFTLDESHFPVEEVKRDAVRRIGFAV